MSDLFLKVDQLGVEGTFPSEDGTRWTIRVEHGDKGWTSEAIFRTLGESTSSADRGRPNPATRRWILILWCRYAHSRGSLQWPWCSVVIGREDTYRRMVVYRLHNHSTRRPPVEWADTHPHKRCPAATTLSTVTRGRHGDSGDERRSVFLTKT